MRAEEARYTTDKTNMMVNIEKQQAMDHINSLISTAAAAGLYHIFIPESLTHSALLEYLTEELFSRGYLISNHNPDTMVSWRHT